MRGKRGKYVVREKKTEMQQNGSSNNYIFVGRSFFYIFL